MVIELTHHEPQFAVAGFGHVVAFVWDTTPTIALVRAGAAALDRAIAQRERFAFVSVIGRASSMPSAAVVDAMITETRRVQARVDTLAVVIESTGFAATAVRSALTAMTIASRVPFPVSWFSHCDEADLFLRERCPSHPRDHSLAAVVSALRSR